jgi:alpha-galactosidase
MKSITSSLFVASAIQSVVHAAPAGQDESLAKRLENGLGKTPALGYNNWVSKHHSRIVTVIMATDRNY